MAGTRAQTATMTASALDNRDTLAFERGMSDPNPRASIDTDRESARRKAKVVSEKAAFAKCAPSIPLDRRALFNAAQSLSIRPTMRTAASEERTNRDGR